MIVHIFVGSKGGIGKTRCSISICLYYLFEKNVDISLFDANFSNIDFFTIMTGSDYKTSKAYRKTSFYSNPIVLIKNDEEIKGLNSDCSIRSYPFELYAGIDDFWNNVYLIAKKSLKDKKKYLIIDTNLAVPNLSSSNDNLRDNKIRGKFKQLSEVGVKRVIIWYVWCLNDFLGIRDELNSDISRMMKNLQDVSNNLFSVQGNLIHVLNPYLFFKAQGGLLEFIKRIGNQTKEILKKLEELLKLGKAIGKAAGFPFDVAVEIFTAIVREIVIQKKDKGDVDFADLIARVIEINNNPLNMVVLEKSDENVFYVKDQLINASLNRPEKNRIIRDYRDFNRADFGKNTLWKKIRELEIAGII